MQLSLVLRTLGVLLILFSVALLPPLLVSVIYRDGEFGHFTATMGVTLLCGLALWLPFAHREHRMRTRDGFVIVALLWVAVGLLGSMPFVFGLGMDLSDAVFESVSGFTTTGATVIVGLDALPPSILFYRQELQWLGGLGVIVLAIALLPMLGVGGMQLFKAETPGPIKDEKLTPRITQTARSLWRIYLVLTLACAFAYWVAGMSVFDALAHSLSTLSTGGFSTHDASIGFFGSPAIEVVAIFFMLLGGINFGLHFLAWYNLSLGHYFRHVEVRVFLGVIILAVALTTLVLYSQQLRPDPGEALRYAAFEVVSVMTSTGYGIDNFAVWPLMLPVLLIFISFMGGCAGSTAGGIKVIRFVLMGKQASLEVQRLIHPNMIRPLKFDGRVVPPRVAEAVWAFFAVYVGVFALLMLFMMAGGMDQVTAFGAVATCLNNLGPGLGDVAANFTTVSDWAKWLLAFAMLLGRLELFTIFVLLTPAFWRQ